MKNALYRFIAFACLGVTTEIVFTATFERLWDTALSFSDKMMLAGHSYIWMIPIYGSAGFLFGKFFPLVEKLPLIARLFVYCAGIYIIEFSTGFLLDLTIGHCPWEYTTGWHFMGYIRWDYAPFWLIFGYILETVHLELNHLLKDKI